jgi:hypothetical protein
MDALREDGLRQKESLGAIPGIQGVWMRFHKLLKINRLEFILNILKINIRN